MKTRKKGGESLEEACWEGFFGQVLVKEAGHKRGQEKKEGK
jgi:hypothetical protein